MYSAAARMTAHVTCTQVSYSHSSRDAGMRRALQLGVHLQTLDASRCKQAPLVIRLQRVVGRCRS